MSDKQATPGLSMNLFKTFFKIGLFTFGGGYAMIPLIQEQTVEKNGWIEQNDILDILAISESVPGPFAVTSATFVGYKVGGTIGSLCAAFGVVLPSFLVITIISFFYEAFMANLYVGYAFKGLGAGVVLLMLSAVVKLSHMVDKNLFNILLAAGAFVAATFFDVSVILLIVIGAVCGIINAGRDKAPLPAAPVPEPSAETEEFSENSSEQSPEDTQTEVLTGALKETEKEEV